MRAVTYGNATRSVLETPRKREIQALPTLCPGTTCRAADFHPYWLNYVRVVDAVKMAAKVEALGGHVLVQPRIDRHGGMVAVVADPSGTPFGLLEWQDSQTKEVTK